MSPGAILLKEVKPNVHSAQDLFVIKYCSKTHLAEISEVHYQFGDVPLSRLKLLQGLFFKALNYIW